MASYAYTFSSGDTVTPQRINNARTVSDIVNADIKSDAAIAHTKLASITAGQVLLGNASNVPTATALSGDVTVNSSGVTAIGSGVIVNADINASAAIDLSKLATGALPTAITVASANLVDGTIVNADINASAAIDLSKLATGALPTAITVASANLVDGTIVNADINSAAAIAHTKLANITAGQVLMGNASNAPTSTALSGDVTVNSSGVTAIGSGVIVDADVNASAAIAHTKLANITAGSVLMGNASNAPTATALSGDVTVNSSGVTAISSGVIVNDDVKSDAAIAHTKLANITAGSVLMGNASNAPTATAVTGDVTISSFGVTAIGSGVIVNADINASADIAGSKLADGSVALAKLVTAVQQALVPAGAVQAFAMNSAPSGWLAADGTNVNRTTYAALFSTIGTTYGSGDGSTTFGLPDLRGYFVRGSGTNSDGTAAGTFGAKQADDFKSHTHTATVEGFATQNVSGGPSPVGTQFGTTTVTTSSAPATGGTETRPKNIAMLYCIKF